MTIAIDKIVDEQVGENWLYLKEHRSNFRVDQVIQYKQRKGKIVRVDDGPGVPYEALEIEWLPNEPITLADFWLPENEDAIGDPRPAIWSAMIERGVSIDELVEVEKNTNCPPSFLGVSCGWYHTIDHGPQDEATFRKDLEGAVERFVDMIAEKYDPFQPIQFYRDANPSYGVSPFTFTGGGMPFDLRLIGMVEHSIVMEVEVDGGKERISSPGVKWFLSTMIVPDKDRDAEVRVGHDWGTKYDA